ncbi:hypothetical protein M8C21_026444 [Ambrosia artemisiifolia]|uniref:Uncharacterized protein n=1 Tax=Ambrosia artemisiifolia TaxID=4212 RepID=A0AAD5CIC3_AMBAR|nr:hypothetical protein M8C21_026444 [Ambrosia artemisiifolia]
MTAAANETPDMELKFGRCDRTKCTEAKIIINDHVNNVYTNFYNQLLWNNNVETEFFPKSMLPELMVPVKSFPRDAKKRKTDHPSSDIA